MLVDDAVGPRLPRGRFGPGGEGGGYEVIAPRGGCGVRGPLAGGARRRDPARPDLRAQQAAEEVGVLFGPLARGAGSSGAGVEGLFQQGNGSVVGIAAIRPFGRLDGVADRDLSGIRGRGPEV